MELRRVLVSFLLLSAVVSYTTADYESPNSIIITTLGRVDYAFDIFALPTDQPPSISTEQQITDGESVNFNGHFPSPSNSFISDLLSDQSTEDTPTLQLVYVTERNGSSSIYYDALFSDDSRTTRKRSSLQVPIRIQVPLLSGIKYSESVNSMKDKPTLSGDYLVYVSNHEDPGEPRKSWTAVYSTELRTGLTNRLTPYGIADFSPAVSPSGVFTAVASYGRKGWEGEVEELSTHIYIFLTRDGTQRVKVVEHGGWPSWIDESTLFFHRRSEDEWISVYKAILPRNGSISTESVKIERVTPPGLHAFTPATSPGNIDFIAVATRRPDSNFRHIELFNLKSNEFTALTRLVSPETHHFNPFISPDTGRVGYHKCRSDRNGRRTPQLFLENLKTPVLNLSLFRFEGSFPSFSPEGDRIAYVDFPGVYVVNRDGSGKRQVYPETAFSTVWNPVREGIVYTSTGPTFATERTNVDIISIDVDSIDQSKAVKKLTNNGKNNAFPSVSPDGKLIVFRSARSGHKNLYIMGVEKGESGGVYRLTEGPWSDTMCSWSPDGDWIAFSSDRHNPGSGSFALYLIHPNGTGLRKLVQSGSGGRVNHPSFSPDGKSIVFTSDYGGISAEPISNSHHYQPYGEIFTVKLNGSDLTRLTYNSYEDGTPAWAPTAIRPLDVASRNGGPQCAFEDCHWLNETPTQTRFPFISMVSSQQKCGA